MKSFAFAAALIAVTQAVELEWGYQPSYSYKPQVSYSQAAPVKAASAAKQADYGRQWGSDFDAWGRDQDLSIDEGYGKTNAKSYTAESYDEWDNTNNDVNGAQAWGKDRDAYGQSSYGKAASKNSYDGYGYGGKAGYGYADKNSYGYAGAKGQGYGNEKMADASAQYGAAKGGYDNDEWAKQAYAQDTDSRWGKSYDSVDAKSYDNEWYERSVWADDDQWAEDYDRYDKQSGDSYGQAASTNNAGYGHGYGYGKKGGVDAASAAGAAGYWGKSASDFDAWGRDQDFKETVRYDNTRAKAYAAESYDEWDNQDNDKYGAQAWGKDRDVYGASSYGKDASSADYGSQRQGGAAYGAAGYGKAYGHGHGYGKGYGYEQAGASYGKAAQAGKDSVWKGASWEGAQQQAGYDNDEWAKQAYGQDYDSRWGKSYDSVSAKSYENESYDRELWADDDQWAEDYDRYDSRDADSYGKAASASYGKDGYGYGHGSRAGYGRAASKAGAADYDARSSSDFDAWGRDQDLSIKESYDQTWAKSYDAESYDEWDNKDNDKYGRQGWGKDRDAYGASSYGKKASDGDYDAYGKAGQAYGAYGKSYGGSYGGHGYGHGKSYGGAASGYAGAAGQAYGAEKQQNASQGYGASNGAYDNDAWAKQAFASDYDSRWGKSYDSVAAKSYDDEQYSRKVRADDDQWAEDLDRYSSKDAGSYGQAASSAYQAPAQKHVSYKPVYSGHSHGYGGYGGYGKW